ncbi:alpha/beta hydrolase fold protein, partial [Nitritalea halalkaliphila LW7]
TCALAPWLAVFSSLHTWAGWEELLGSSFRTLSVDLPGHGLTGPSPQNCYTSSCYADLLWEMLDQLRIEKVHLVGNSMGGGVALIMADQAPERVLSLGLISSSTPRPRRTKDMSADAEEKQARFPTPDHASAASTKNPTPSGQPSVSSGNASGRPLIFRILENPTWSGLLSKATPKFLFRWNLQQVFAQPDRITDELVSRYYDMMLREGNRAATLARLRSGGSPAISYERFATLPTYILWGEEDAWIPLRRGEWLHQQLPHAQFQVLPEVGHVAMEEVPEISGAAYLEFLRDIQ